MKATPKAVPVSLILEKNAGKAVAAKTVIIDIRGRDDVPAGNSVRVRKFPNVTRVDATDIAMQMVGRDMEDFDSSSMESSAIDVSLDVSVVSPGASARSAPVGSPDFAIEKRKAKYKATTMLSAATANKRNEKPALA